MASRAFRLTVLLSAIATSPLLAQSSASQLVTVGHASGQSVSPVYGDFDFNGHVDDDADFQPLVDERKAKPASTSSAQNR